MGTGIFSSKCHGLPKLKWDLDHFTGWPDYKMNYKNKFCRKFNRDMPDDPDGNPCVAA
jgi:hypothetical protein